MQTYFDLIDTPKGDNCVRAIVHSWVNEEDHALEFFIIVNSESQAKYIERNTDCFTYCDNVADLIETLVSGECLCTTNGVFLEAINEIEKLNEQEETFTQLILLNDKLPWLENLANGEVKMGIPPDIFRMFESFYPTVMVDENESGIRKYCDLNGFTAKSFDIFK